MNNHQTQAQLGLFSIAGSPPTNRCKFMREVEVRYKTTPKERILCSSPLAVRDAFSEMVGLMRESFVVLHLNTKNEVNSFETVAVGMADKAMISTREALRTALVTNSPGVIFVHNHPSGHTEPSAEDEAICNLLVQAAQILDIRVVDFIIIGDGVYSFLEHGKLTQP